MTILDVMDVTGEQSDGITAGYRRFSAVEFGTEATMILCIFLFIFISCSQPAGAQVAQSSKGWTQLVTHGEYKKARALCTSWLNSPKIAAQVEGHKCLANVALGEDPSAVSLQSNDVGGGMLQPGFTSQAVDESIQHLNAALKLAPQDITLHKGRLHVLEMAARYDEMARALDESCRIYKGNAGADEWLDYTTELFEDKHYRAGLELLREIGSNRN